MASTTIVRSASSAVLPAQQIQPAPEEVRGQLGRILSSPLFRNSRHYPALLRYVVEETLEGRHGHLKERSLGVEVFGREPNYDTNLDPVVRTSACEVRKRLAQYYHEHEDGAPVRIDLPHGSYVPEFRYREVALAPAAPPELAPVTLPAPESEPALPRFSSRLRIAAIGLALVLASGAALAWRLNRSALDRFWSPFWNSSDSIMISMGGPLSYATPIDPPPTVAEFMGRDHVAFSDAVTMGRLTGLFRENRKRFDIRKGPAFTLNDFRKGPVVLIGAFNNPWTLRLENQMRFDFEHDAVNHTVSFIHDRQNPSRTNWRVDSSIPYSKLAADYAIVSRVLDPLTEKSVVVVAGLTKDGTMAAGEFATEERYLETMARQAPSGWEHKNLQVVIATEIINGNPGPPRILATYFW
jgi:hypothetical protein